MERIVRAPTSSLFGYYRAKPCAARAQWAEFTSPDVRKRRAKYQIVKQLADGAARSIIANWVANFYKDFWASGGIVARRWALGTSQKGGGWDLGVFLAEALGAPRKKKKVVPGS